MTSFRTDQFKPGLFAFCVFATLWSVLLLYAGGFTTSIEAGMAFLDWPLSNGSINPEGWLADEAMLAEHSHRLLGMKLGLLSIGIALWTHFRESRRWVRMLAWALLGTIIFQGMLGGLRVLVDPLNTSAAFETITLCFLVAHACGAQIVVCLLVAITLGHSRFWAENSQPMQSNGLRNLGFAACGTLFATILAGAITRHIDAGMSVPYFPAATESGSLWPNYMNGYVAAHMAHRVLALVATLVVLAFAVQLFTKRQQTGIHPVLPLLPVVALGMQVSLGALVIWTRINEHAATFHMLFGAVLLSVCWAMSLRAARCPILQTSHQRATATRPEKAGAVAAIPASARERHA